MMNLRTLLALVFLVLVAACSKDENPVVVSSFEPATGDYGTEVTITGSLFSTDANSNTVLFGGVNAEVITASSSQLVVKVPLGAKTGKVTVKANGETGTSSSDFTVTAGSWNTANTFPKYAYAGADLFFSIGDKGYIHVGKRNINGVDVDASMWMYNPSDNTWTQKKEYSKTIQQSQPAIAFGTSDKGYILTDNELWEYDPTSDSWTKQDKLPVVFYTQVPYKSFYMSSTNRVYVIMSNGYWMVYNPETDIWSMNSDAPFGEAVDNNRDGFVVQATNTHGYLKVGTTLWQYTPDTNSWSNVSTFPGGTFSNFTFSIGDNVYIGSTVNQELYVYKPSLNAWAQKANVSTTRQKPIYFTLGENGYLGMGITSSLTLLNDFNEFMP